MSETSAPPVMLGLEMPDVDAWSERVIVALGQNPGAFTGPGTNTYLVGTGSRRILVDTGQGEPAYLPVLEAALERGNCDGLQEIVLTHGHPDHSGGVESVLDRFGPVEVKKFPWPAFDDRHDFAVTPLSDGSVVKTEGATLRALHTPGHAPDHLCFMLEEDDALISGDNVLGVGTTVIPSESGDLADYMNSLDLALEQRPSRIYPAHGPLIDDGVGKLEEYIAHRKAREVQILAALEAGEATAAEIVAIVYAEYPKLLHAAASQSVTSHLLKLQREQRVDPDGTGLAPSTRWAVRAPR